MPGDAPAYGAHTAEIPREPGEDPDGIRALRDRGVTADGWLNSECYLPD